MEIAAAVRPLRVKDMAGVLKAAMGPPAFPSTCVGGPTLSVGFLPLNSRATSCDKASLFYKCTGLLTDTQVSKKNVYPHTFV